MQWIKKLPIIRIFIRWYDYITCLAPLQEFDNYDSYWQSRHINGYVVRELDRFKIIAKKLQGNESVLDIGCGDCSFQVYLKKVKPNCKTLGVDASEEAIKIGKSWECNAQIIDQTRSLHNQIIGQWDVITIMEVIEHIPEAESLMKQIIELNPKRIFITIPNVGCLKHRARLMFGGRFPITTIVYHMREHLRFWTVKDFKQWTDSFDLEIKSVHGQFSYGDRITEWFVRKFPALFAAQLVYELTFKDDITDK